jgi:hypothetical protein
MDGATLGVNCQRSPTGSNTCRTVENQTHYSGSENSLKPENFHIILHIAHMMRTYVNYYL